MHIFKARSSHLVVVVVVVGGGGGGVGDNRITKYGPAWHLSSPEHAERGVISWAILVLLREISSKNEMKI